MKHNTKLNQQAVNGTFSSKSHGRLLARIAARRERNKTIRQLNGLSDSLLRDIGIERYEIAQAAKTPLSYIKLLTRETEQVCHETRLKIAA